MALYVAFLGALAWGVGRVARRGAGGADEPDERTPAPAGRRITTTPRPVRA
jgi:hypothetical protein